MSGSALPNGASGARPSQTTRSLTSQLSVFYGSEGGSRANPVPGQTTAASSYTMSAFRVDANQPFSPFCDASGNLVTSRSSGAATAVDRVTQLLPRT